MKGGRDGAREGGREGGGEGGREGGRGGGRGGEGGREGEREGEAHIHCTCNNSRQSKGKHMLIFLAAHCIGTKYSKVIALTLDHKNQAR